MHFVKKMPFFFWLKVSDLEKKTFFPYWKYPWLQRWTDVWVLSKSLADFWWLHILLAVDKPDFVFLFHPRLDSRNFRSQTSISLGKSSLKITYITYFSLETASSPLLSINNSSHRGLGLIAPSLKAALTLMCLFPILISSSELFCCSDFKPQHWGPGGGGLMGSCPPFLAPGLSSLHPCQHHTWEHEVSWACISNPSGATKPKKVIVWNSCFPGHVVLWAGDIFGGCVKKHKSVWRVSSKLSQQSTLRL